MLTRALGFASILLLAGCAVGPKYKRPDAALPTVYRDASAPPGQPSQASLADEKWWEVFQDTELQTLIRTALKQNYDLRITAARILQAQASHGITRADQFPTITGAASATNSRIPKTKILPGVDTSTNSLALSLFWELDFWGKYRRATEAARADLLATEWGQRAVMTTLVSNVATAYFQLRELDLELEVSKQALTSRQESLRLAKVRATGGVSSMIDVHQSEQLVYEAGGSIPDLERRITQQENLISTLIGSYSHPITRGRRLVENPIAPTVPVGLPSSLLERRADIQAAEQALVAANARIGVAKAAYFPQISLTATAGYQSTALTNLFTGPAGLWNFGGQLAQPIFEGGRIRSGVRLSEAQQQQTLLAYEQAIQVAFQQVSDSLIAYRKTQEVREQQSLLTEAARNTVELSQSRYAGGVTSYLEVLDSDTRYLTAEISLAQDELNERLALVQLYAALGGGWQQ